MSPSPRKNCKRYDTPGDPLFLTFSCFQRLPLLSRDRTRHWMLDALVLGRQRGLYDLWAYVVMPEHVHLVLRPHKLVAVATILKTIKQSVSKRAIRWLETNSPAFLVKLEHTQADGRVVCRFWQRGGGYDRNLRSAADVHAKIDYVHANPVRRGLVDRAEHWRWSSCHAWATGVDMPIPIDRESVPRVRV